MVEKISWGAIEINAIGACTWPRTTCKFNPIGQRLKGGMRFAIECEIQLEKVFYQGGDFVANKFRREKNSHR